MSAPSEAPEAAEEAIWQDVEFGSYDADLPLWAELAGEAGGPVLELGAGAGRVALHLADQGFDVIALERQSDLLAELERRASRLDVSLTIVQADLASPGRIRLPAEPALVIAPLHVLQTLDGGARLSLIGALRDLVSPGTILAASLVDESTLLSAGTSAPQILPDMRELDGWVYSSEPLWVQVRRDQLKVRRIRKRVSPGGEIQRTVHDELLQRISAERFQIEGQEAGFETAGRRAVHSGESEADSVVAMVAAR